jgi:hypothetical protein
MSRARENADGARLDAPLASPTFTGTVAGVTGTHITTGTLGNTVQDNITRLGTVTAGNISHADIVYPTGHVISQQISTLTDLNGSSDYSVNTTTRTAIDASIAFPTISGNTYLIEVSCRIYIYDTGVSTATRRGYVQLYYDANVAQAATSLGTLLSDGMFGRYLVTASSADAYSFDNAYVWGAFVADATETNYFTVSASTDTTDTRVVFDASAATPQTRTVTGFQGDVYTLNP